MANKNTFYCIQINKDYLDWAEVEATVHELPAGEENAGIIARAIADATGYPVRLTYIPKTMKPENITRERVSRLSGSYFFPDSKIVEDETDREDQAKKAFFKLHPELNP